VRCETRLVVRAADALIAIGGDFGTLSEIAFALKTG
jgi:predicted Rossmann-fold nucleotide-binding protein